MSEKYVSFNMYKTIYQEGKTEMQERTQFQTTSVSILNHLRTLLSIGNCGKDAAWLSRRRVKTSFMILFFTIISNVEVIPKSSKLTFLSGGIIKGDIFIISIYSKTSTSAVVEHHSIFTAEIGHEERWTVFIQTIGLTIALGRRITTTH